MTKTRVTQRAVKTERIRTERKKLRSRSKHRITNEERYPVMKRGSQTGRNWSKVHVDVFRPGAPPCGLKFNSASQNAYFRLVVMMYGHRTWIPKTKLIFDGLQLSERRVRFQLQILTDLRLIEIVPIESVDAEYHGCQKAIVILDLPDWYFNHSKQNNEEIQHYQEVARRRNPKRLRIVSQEGA